MWAHTTNDMYACNSTVEPPHSNDETRPHTVVSEKRQAEVASVRAGFAVLRALRVTRYPAARAKGRGKEEQRVPADAILRRQHLHKRRSGDRRSLDLVTAVLSRERSCETTDCRLPKHVLLGELKVPTQAPLP